MRVIFLDIDGVLNNDTTTAKCGRYTGVDPDLAKLYRDWLAPYMAAGAVKVVLSSTWRNHPDMHPHLHQNGIFWSDVTPRLNMARGFDIQAYMAKNLDITHYVMLDDLRDFLPDQMKHLVQTNGSIGLTANDLLRATTVLRLDHVNDQKGYPDKAQSVG